MGKETEEAERYWEHIWRPIVIRADGTVDIDQLKKEFADFSFMIQQVPRVYSHVTGGMMSKPNYFADQVIAVHDDYVTARVDDAILEIREALWIAHTCSFYPMGTKKKDDDLWSCEACGIDFTKDEFEDIAWSTNRLAIDTLTKERDSLREQLAKANAMITELEAGR